MGAGGSWCVGSAATREKQEPPSSRVFKPFWGCGWALAVLAALDRLHPRSWQGWV